ncbi:GyrI-like domain-containing protein [Sphingobacterium faecium]|uniref:GyrI-like domain-containing protein n=1 Tax=Sphingobacterium faecium TaxID=34087 RepID=UPI0021B6BDDD|nr:GyrI-like domain-containing protein [Sphingobacterium faecium]UXD71158.1 GyrI-like domain-containing protein [Sphingobacterium faecium]
MENITIQEKKIIGMVIRTTNENGQSANDIELLWQKFWKDETIHQVEHKISNDIYAVYTHYETDFTGYYETIIGYEVSVFTAIPEGFVSLVIEGGNFAKFVSTGKMPEAVFNTWLDIWADKEFNLKRAYKSDFTVHGEKYNDGPEAEVETYISVKN